MKSIAEMILVMEHFEKGGEVERKSAMHDWFEIEDPKWDWTNCDYRIKPDSVKKVKFPKWLYKKIRHTDNKERCDFIGAYDPDEEDVSPFIGVRGRYSLEHLVDEWEIIE